MQPQDTNANPGPSSVRPVGAAGAAGAARPVRPVVRRPVTVGGASAAPVTPAPEPVKNSGPSFDNGPSVVGKKERKTGWILAIILLLLIAAGGVGFGVWMWMDGNTQKEALNNQINSLQQTNSDLATQLDNANSMINVDADGNELDTADYIYVGEWGIKIKKPEDWRDLISEYSFSNDYPQAVDTFTIKEISDSDIANILISNRGEASCDSLSVAPDVCFEIGGNNFVVSISDDVSDTLKAYFIEEDNYSEI